MIPTDTSKFGEYQWHVSFLPLRAKSLKDYNFVDIDFKGEMSKYYFAIFYRKRTAETTSNK